MFGLLTFFFLIWTSDSLYIKCIFDNKTTLPAKNLLIFFVIKYFLENERQKSWYNLSEISFNSALFEFKCLSQIWHDLDNKLHANISLHLMPRLLSALLTWHVTQRIKQMLLNRPTRGDCLLVSFQLSKIFNPYHWKYILIAQRYFKI